MDKASKITLVAATLFTSFTSFELYKESIPHLFSAQTVEYQSLSLCPGTNTSDRKPSRWARKTMQKIRGEGGQQLTAAK